jgi:serine/threonine protein kinase
VTGQIIKDYTLGNILGKGGMATVYLATDKKFQTNVAVKVLNKEFIHNENIRQRFLAEARNMFRMSHPNVIKVTDLIDEDNLVAFVMDYVEGPTLKDYLDAKSSLSDQEIERLFSQMLAAVGYVHEQGMVHRDIKPSNFIISKKGDVKLLDFGIAKNTELTAAEYTMTSTTQNMGTPMYMSPEQIKSSKDVQARSDIYSLGVVLWQMVTRRKPYDAQTLSTFDIQSKIVNDPLSLTGTGWDVIIKKATQKEISNRYTDIYSFQQAVKVMDIESDKTQLLQQDADRTIIDKQTSYSRPIISNKILNYCTKCGKENPGTAKFCTACGVALVSAQQPSIHSKNNFNVIVISLSVLLAAAVCFYIYINNKSKPGPITGGGTDTTAVQQPEPFIPKNSYTIPEQFSFVINKDKIAKWTTNRRFFPIGWSRDGKFAYVEENNSDVVSEYYFDLYIQDLVTDKVLWHWNFTVSEEDNNQEDQKAGFKTDDDNDANRRKVWKKYSQINVNKLNEYQIEPIDITTLEQFPLKISNNSGSFSLKNQTYNNPASGFTEILATSVYFTVNGTEKKRIFSQKYATGVSEWNGHLSNQIPGFFKSPFENRIALFLLDEYNAWETYSEWTFTIIGCDLNNVGLY